MAKALPKLLAQAHRSFVPNTPGGNRATAIDRRADRTPVQNDRSSYSARIAPDPYDFNLRHIRAIAAIAKAGSISGGGDAVSLSQPALTQGLARLETLLDTRLFERLANGVVITATGKVMAERSDEMFEQLARGLRQREQRGRGFAEPEQLLTMTQLRAFLALSDSGSFELAVTQTGLSRSALCRAVRDLEQLVGVPLTERHRRGVSLTAAGRRAARSMRIAIGAFKAALAEVAALQGAPAEELILVGTVGALPLTRARLLPRALAEFRTRFPDASVRVMEGSHREMIDQLREGHLDIVVGALGDLPSESDLRQDAVIEDELVIVARTGHPLGKMQAFDALALARYDWVVGLPGSPRRRHWEAMFDVDPRPPAPIECGSMPTVRELLLTSDMLSLLPPDQVRIEVAAGIMTILDIPLETSFHLVGTTIRADWRPTDAQSAFVAQIQHIAHDEFERDQFKDRKIARARHRSTVPRPCGFS